MKKGLINKYQNYAATEEAFAVLFVRNNLRKALGHWVDITDSKQYEMSDDKLHFRYVRGGLFRRKIDPMYPKKSMFTVDGVFNEKAYILAVRAITWETAKKDIDYRAKYASGRPTIGKMMADVADLCLIHAIGLLVIDEFQHMNLAKSGGEKKMINFLVTLVNVVEVSVILIGTPKALRLFTSEFRQARRASGDGSIVWDRLPFDESWEDFLTELWSYQWLNNKVERTEPLTNKLYELSQGIPDIVVKLFCLAQARAILLADSDEDEMLSVELFDDVFEEEFSIVRPMLEALRSGNKKKVEECNDLVFPKLEESIIGAFDRLVSQPLPKPKPIELGEPAENNVANSAISAIVSMGIAEDIARPLVTDAIARNPDLQLLHLMQLVTTSLTQDAHQTVKTKKMKEKPIYTSSDNWGQLSDRDLRKIYSDKTGSQYEALLERKLIYPIGELLAG